MKKKKKTFYPLPADGAPYRPSFSLGLWITALEAMLIVIPMLIPTSIALGIITEPKVGIILAIVFPIATVTNFGLAWPIAALIGRLSSPVAGIVEDRLYVTDRPRSVPMAEIVSLRLDLGHFSKTRTEPPRLTIHLPCNDTFEMIRPSLRLIRSIRRAAPKAAFSVNWKERFGFLAIAGFVGGLIIAAFLLLK